GGDDITRDLFFHVDAFRGVAADLQAIEAMLDCLGKPSARAEITVPFDPKHPDHQEKALHRLVVIGVVDDYTLDYSRKEFTVRLTGTTQGGVVDSLVRYIGTYQEALAAAVRTKAEQHLGKEARAFMLGIAAELIHHIYRHIERSRRRMLLVML